MKGAMATAKALAEELGVSIATVSRALNGKPGISPRLRQHILNEAARRNTYVTPAARMLATSRTQNVCFAIYHLSGPLSNDPFYFQVLSGLEEETKKAGLNLTIEMLGDEEVKDPSMWRIVRERRADGVILLGPFIPNSFIISLNHFDIPITLIDNHVEGALADSVVADDRKAAQQLAMHLIELNHKKVAVLSGPRSWYSNQERVRGFRDAFIDAGITPPEVIYTDATTHESGFKAAAQALTSTRTALIAVNDAMALGAMDYAFERGLNIPNELSITGFDDVIGAQTARIPLTTVSVPKHFIGKMAGRLLWSRLEDRHAPQQRVDVSSSLVIRESTTVVSHEKRRGKRG